MNKETRFNGLGVAIVTPMNKDKSIDFKGLSKLTEHLISNDVDYIVVQGTTGESVTLTVSEKQKTLDVILQVNQGRVPVVFGVGGNNTLEVCQSFKKYDLTGVAAILSVSPAYNKPSQEGIYQHFKAISLATELPIILYNVPSRTGSNMSAKTTLRLAENFNNIIAIKEASGDLGQIMQILHEKPKNFEVISGDGLITLPLMALGVVGVISVIGNAFPKEVSMMVELMNKGDVIAARQYHFQLLDIMNAIFLDGNPAGIKEVLQELGVCENYVRLPLVNVNEEVQRIIKNNCQSMSCFSVGC